MHRFVDTNKSNKLKIPTFWGVLAEVQLKARPALEYLGLKECKQKWLIVRWKGQSLPCQTHLYRDAFSHPLLPYPVPRSPQKRLCLNQKKKSFWPLSDPIWGPSIHNYVDETLNQVEYENSVYFKNFKKRRREGGNYLEKGKYVIRVIFVIFVKNLG